MGDKSKKKEKVSKKLKEKKEKKLEKQKSKKRVKKQKKKAKKKLRNIVLEKNITSNNKEIQKNSNPIVKIEKSKNFNVTIARDKIRSFTCEKLLANFVKGDIRITVNKAAAIRKRQINKL